MFFSNWLRNRLTNPRSKCRGPRRRTGRFRPGLVILEDRAVPAILNVTTSPDEVDPNDGLLSLREAVLQANAINATNGHDTIVVPAGLYLLNGGGELAVTDNVTIAGAGADATVIDGGGAHRVFHLTGPSQVSISGVTIQGGHPNPPNGVYGGGILSEVNVLTIDHSTIAGNSAVLGGGIAALGGTFAGSVTVTHSTISGNAAGYSGGGIWCDETMLTVDDSTLSGNSAIFDGGAIYAQFSGLTVDHSTLCGNSALGGAGGGILDLQGAAMTVKDCTISGNSAFNQGGGLDAYLTYAVTVKDCTITGNSAYRGGGIFVSDIYNNIGGVSIEHSTLSGNTALQGGGLYAASYSSVEMDQSTLDDPIGSGIFNDNSTIHLKKTVVDGVRYDNRDYF